MALSVSHSCNVCFYKNYKSNLNKIDQFSIVSIFIIYYILFTSLGNCLSTEEVMLLVNSVDRDGDGVLDFEEFIKIMLDRND